MSRPIVGIISNSHIIDDTYPIHNSGTMNFDAIAEVAGCMPIMFPADPNVVTPEELMAVCDGFLFTGGRPNVHPSEYGEEETPAHGAFDQNRDRVALPLIRACVDTGQPILGICRGFQELNVAMGGSLYPEIRDLPGRDNHRMPPDGTLDEKFALRHDVTVTEGGVFHEVFGQSVVKTNSLHGQGIKEPGARIVIDGTAPDGTPEAIYVENAGFALAVQWHPEWQAGIDPVSKPLFEAFGDAVRDYKDQRL